MKSPDNNINLEAQGLKPWPDMRPLRAGFSLLARGGSLRIQILGEELRDLDGRADAVVDLTPAVPFVGEQDVLDGNSSFLECGNDLLGLNHRDIGVIGLLTSLGLLPLAFPQISPKGIHHRSNEGHGIENFAKALRIAAFGSWAEELSKGISCAGLFG